MIGNSQRPHRASEPQRHTAPSAAGGGDLIVHGHEIEGGLLLVGRLPCWCGLYMVLYGLYGL